MDNPRKDAAHGWLPGNVAYAVARTTTAYAAIGTPFHPYCLSEITWRDSVRRRFSYGDINPADLDGQRCGYCNDDWRPEPKRLEPFPGAVSRHCLNCPPKPTTFPMDGLISVGFGTAVVTCDGDYVLDGEGSYQNALPDVTGADAEKRALSDPDHDWRIVMGGPMGGQEYQRHGEGQWVYVKRLPGFA